VGGSVSPADTFPPPQPSPARKEGVEKSPRRLVCVDTARSRADSRERPWAWIPQGNSDVGSVAALLPDPHNPNIL